MTAASVLREARQIITPKGKWTQEATARDKLGNEVKPTNASAVAFCMIGAIQKLAPSNDDYSAAIRILRAQCGTKSTFEFNDTHHKKTVLAALDKAALVAEGEAV